MEDLLTGANIFTIIIGTIVTLLNTAITAWMMKQNSKTEERRVDLESKRVEQEEDRSEVDAAERLTNTAVQLSNMSAGVAERLQVQINEIQQTANQAKAEATATKKVLKTLIAAWNAALAEAKGCGSNGHKCPFLQPAFLALVDETLRVYGNLKEITWPQASNISSTKSEG